MGVKLGSFEKGLFVYEDTTSTLVEKRYIKYDKKDLSIYKDKFKDLVGEGIFEEDSSFEDHKWKALGNQYYRIFDFSEFEYNQQLYLSLKCFVILQLYDRRLVVDSTFRYLRYILNTIRMTAVYDKKFLEEFDEFIHEKINKTLKAANFYKQSNLSFIYFSSINDSRDYLATLLSISDLAGFGLVREIPTYSNFILFDEIMHHFMSTTTRHLRVKYYPVFIWWRLTSIIPIRPIEFIEILNENIIYDKEIDAYYILIQRRKTMPDPINKSYHVNTQPKLKINKEMYEIICDYRKSANIEHEKYLFPLNSYTANLKSIESNNTYIPYKENINWGQMTYLLDNFFDEVIQSQYNIRVVESRDELDSENENRTIKRFNLGDTRHMSICMLMMQGFSELTIAQMAGHNNIRTQSHYSSHIDDFQRSYSGLLEKEILQKMNLSNQSGFDSFTFRQKQLLNYSTLDNPNPRKKDFGFCHSKNFPYECFSKDCFFCNKFQLDLLNLSESEKTRLSSTITKVQDEIKVKMNFIKKYYGAAYKRNFNDVHRNEKDIKDLARNSMNLNILMNQEAMMKAHLRKHKEV